MLFKEIITVYAENYTKTINTYHGKNAELQTVKQMVYIITTGP
jgi:hypothetical protein